MGKALGFCLKPTASLAWSRNGDLCSQTNFMRPPPALAIVLPSPDDKARAAGEALTDPSVPPPLRMRVVSAVMSGGAFADEVRDEIAEMVDDGRLSVAVGAAILRALGLKPSSDGDFQVGSTGPSKARPTVGAPMARSRRRPRRSVPRLRTIRGICSRPTGGMARAGRPACCGRWPRAPRIGRSGRRRSSIESAS